MNAAYLAVSCEKLDQRLDEYAKTLEDVPVGEASQEVNVAISICESKTAYVFYRHRQFSFHSVSVASRKRRLKHRI